ncbi:MAG: LysR substrate-binding domain-containing protein [Bacteroidota bacterium]
MTIQQLEYVVAIDRYGKFSEAAEHCFVTQPTLSMQLKKLEEELDLVIFDRKTQPVTATPAGKVVLEQARQILKQVAQLQDWVQGHKNKLEGELRLGIIPTLAPYLVPHFLGAFMRNFPNVHLKILEIRTEYMLQAMVKKEIDLGLLVTPIQLPKSIQSRPLFYEKFMAYLKADVAEKFGHRIKMEDLLNEQLWVLSEGNCFRSQTINLCAMSQLAFREQQFTYESGSLEALMRLVDREGGATLLPELSVLELDESRIENVKFIGKNNPVREVSVVYHQDFAKLSLLEALSNQVLESLPDQIRENTSGDLVVAV